MENPPFEDVFPIQDGDFPASYVCLPEVYVLIPSIAILGAQPCSWLPYQHPLVRFCFRHQVVDYKHLGVKRPNCSAGERVNPTKGGDCKGSPTPKMAETCRLRIL